jgi:hypothetical protein
MRDAFGRLVVTSAASALALAEGQRMQSGFVRDAKKRLVVVGPEGGGIAEKSEVKAADQSYGRRLWRTMAEELQDASIVIVGDSESSAYNSWVETFVKGLGALFPKWTIKYQDWTDGEAAYNAATTKQAGTGARTLTIFNCSVSSVNAYYQMAPNFDVMIASKQPDLIFFAHGQNHGGAGIAPGYWQEALIVTTQSILRACPTSEIVVIATNPRTDASGTVQAERQFVTERVAQLSGFGFINIWNLFFETDPAFVSLLDGPGVHPNAAGNLLWGNYMLKLFAQQDAGPLSSLQRPSLNDTVVVNALANGNFAEFAAPPVLTSWNVTNATLSKDEVNFESNTYSVKVLSASAATAYMIQSVSAATLKRIKGEWVTALVRVRIPVGQAVAAGQINIVETGGPHAGQNGTGTLVANGQGDWRWAMCQRRIGKEATNVQVQILSSATAVIGELSVDRAILTPGIWPRDIR